MPTVLDTGYRYAENLTAIHAAQGLPRYVRAMCAAADRNGRTFIDGRFGIGQAYEQAQELLQSVVPVERKVFSADSDPEGEGRLITVRERPLLVFGAAVCQFVIADTKSNGEGLLHGMGATMYVKALEPGCPESPDTFAPGDRLFRLDGLGALYGPELNIQNVLGVLALFGETQE